VTEGIPGLDQAPTRHGGLIAWVREIAALTRPARVQWCDGSQPEWEQLTGLLTAQGTLIRLNPDRRPDSFAACSDPSDAVAVCDGVVSISGRVEYRSTVRRLVAAARRAEGVIQVDDQLSYDIDDLYPAIPACL
jgi:phosphoenolpyruvate carboxykinase (GTP)